MSEVDDVGEDALVPSGWSPRHYKVAMLLASGRPTKEVAAEAGVSRETVWRYQQLPGFQELVDRLTTIYFKGLVNQMWAVTEHSMEVLHEALDQRDTDAALDIFKTAAPGLRDIITRRPEQKPSLPASSEATSTTQAPPEIDANVVEHECRDCGKRMKSARGLAQHTRRKH